MDGEVVCFDAEGRTSFRALQQRFHLIDPAEIRARAERYPAYVFLFDLLWLDGRDLTGKPLSERKGLLREAVRWSDRVRWTEFREGKGKALFRAGVPARRRGHHRQAACSSPYVPAASPRLGEGQVPGPAGVRHRRLHRPAALPRRPRGPPGRLLSDDGKRLVYAGKVGTGYTRETLLDLRRRLDHLERPKAPFDEGDPPAGPATSTGSGRSWWPRSPSPSGRRTGCCGSRASRGCGPTRSRGTAAASGPATPERRQRSGGDHAEDEEVAASGPRRVRGEARLPRDARAGRQRRPGRTSSRSSSSRSTTPRACTTTSGWRPTACSRAGR